MEAKEQASVSEQTTAPTDQVTNVHSEDQPWTKTVKPEWGTWCGNLLPTGVGAISDGYSLFLEEKSDPKRYAKLGDQLSVYQGSLDAEVVLDSTGAEPLVLVGVFDIQAIEKARRGPSRVTLKYAAVFKRHRGVNIIVNAQRLRCAMLVSKAKYPWIGADGRVYVCDREDTGLDLFGDAPSPLAAIAPLTTRKAWEIETLI